MTPTNDLEACRPAETLLLPEPPKTHAAVKDRSEITPAILLKALPTMQSSEFRNRLPQLQSSSNIGGVVESAKASGIELTPTSSEDSESGKEKDDSDSWGVPTFRQIRKSITSTLSSDLAEEDDKAFNEKHGYNKIKHEEVEKFPRGFPRLAAFQSYFDDFYIFRGFRRSHGRILLQLEVDITQLEKALDKLDNEDNADPNMWYRLSNTEDDKAWDPKQRDLVDKLKTKMKEYDEWLLNTSRIQALGRPSARDHRSLFNWVYTKNELSPTEYQDFIFYEDDFVSAMGESSSSRTSEGGFIEEWIRSHLSDHPDSLLARILRSGKEPTKARGPRIDSYSPFKLAVLYRIILLSLSVGVLLIPVFLLFLVPMSHSKMTAIVFAFVVLFGVMLSSAKDATTQDVFVGMAAYAAVLVNFLGNLSGNQGYGSGNSTA